MRNLYEESSEDACLVISISLFMSSLLSSICFGIVLILFRTLRISLLPIIQTSNKTREKNVRCRILLCHMQTEEDTTNKSNDNNVGWGLTWNCHYRKTGWGNSSVN